MVGIVDDDNNNLQAAYNKALTEILYLTYKEFEKDDRLVNINTYTDWQRILERVFYPILKCPRLNKDYNMVWLSAWIRQLEESGDSLYIPLPQTAKDEDEEKARKIIEAWQDKNWKEHTTSLSRVASECETKDRSFFFWSGNLNTNENTDFEEIVNTNKSNNMFVIVNVTEIDNILWGDVKKDREYLFKKSTEQITREEVAKIQMKRIDDKSDNWSILREILKSQLADSFGDKLTTKVLNRLINYYCWVRLAYGGQDKWRVMLYLPGIIAKHYESIPYGLNIGLKSIPTVADLMFLMRATLTLFTRLSVDYYEAKAKNLADKKESETRGRMEGARSDIEQLISEFGKIKQHVENVKAKIDPNYLSPGLMNFESLQRELTKSFSGGECDHNPLKHKNYNCVGNIITAQLKINDGEKISNMNKMKELWADQFTKNVTDKMLIPFYSTDLQEIINIDDNNNAIPAVFLAKNLSKNRVPLSWINIVTNSYSNPSDWFYSLNISDQSTPIHVCLALYRLKHLDERDNIDLSLDISKIKCTCKIIIKVHSDGKRELANLCRNLLNNTKSGDTSSYLLELKKSSYKDFEIIFQNEKMLNLIISYDIANYKDS